MDSVVSAFAASPLRFVFLRGHEVDDARGLGKSARYHDIAAGLWPPPVKVGKCALWPSHEVDAVLRANLRGANDDELRELVADLVAARTAPAEAA